MRDTTGNSLLGLIYCLELVYLVFDNVKILPLLTSSELMSWSHHLWNDYDRIHHTLTVIKLIGKFGRKGHAKLKRGKIMGFFALVYLEVASW